MTFKALRRPHELGRTTTLTTNVERSRRRPAAFQRAPARSGLVGRWTVTGEGRLKFTWELEPPRSAFRLITRKRGSHA